MRVVQINSVCGTGSTGRIATDIDKMLKNIGHESYIAYGRGEARDCDTAIRIGNNFDNYLHVGTTRVFDRHGFGSTKATKRFINELEDLNPDIIHLHNIHGYYLNIELLFDYLKKANKQVVWTLHDCWAFTGHCAYFDYIECDKWKIGCEKCPQKESYPSSIMMDNSKWNFQRKKELFTSVKNITIVTPSKWLAGLVEKSFLAKYPIKVINNGIDLNIFKPTRSDFREKYDIGNKLMILGVASVWDKRKGLDDFIRLSEILEERYVIVLVGLSPKQIKLLPNNIIGISRTNNIRELAEIYSSADVFFNPTYEDNYPTTNLEAIACGTPVITYNTGGSPECINSTNGIIFEKEKLDFESIKEVIAITRKNGATNLDMFNKDNCYIKYSEIYNQSKI